MNERSDKQHDQKKAYANDAHFCRQLTELDQIYKYSPVGLVVIDQDMRFVRINERMAEIDGKSVEEHIGRTVDEVLPDLAEKLKEIYRSVLKTGEPIQEMEITGSTPKAVGMTRHWLADYYPMESEDGEIIGVLGAITEITERKRMEEALKQSEAFLNSIIEHSPASMWISDENGTMVMMNQKCRELFQLGDEDLVGKYNVFKDNIVEEQGVMPLVRRVFEKGETVTFPLWYNISELKNFKFESDLFYLNVTISPVIDDNGKVTNAIIQHMNMTEHKRAEEALKESEERFHAIFDSVNDAIFIHDTQTYAIVDVNQRTCEMFGYTYEETLGISVDDMSSGEPPYTQQHAFEIMRKSVEENPQIVEWHSKHKSGNLFWTEINVRKANIRGQERILVVVRDITKRKKVEMELLSTNKSLRAIIDSSPLSIVVFDPNMNVISWNSAAEATYGWTEEEVIGRRSPYVPKGTEADYQGLWDKVVAGEGFVNEQASRIKKDGTPIETLVSAYTVKDESGVVESVISISIDITKRKRAEEALSKEKAFTDAVLDSIPGLLYLYDDQGYLLRWNKQHEKLTGYSAKELDHFYVMDWYKGEEEDTARIQKAIKKAFTKGYGDAEANLITKSGARIPFYFTGVRLTIDEKLYLVGIGVDITERKRAENELALTNEELRTINRLITMTTGVADLRSILDMAMDEALTIVGLEGATVCLIKPDDVFELVAHRATSDATIADIETGEIRVGECLCGMCAKTGIPLILSTKDEVLDYATREVLRGEDIKFHAAFPLMVESKCVGVLCVFTRTDNKPTERSLKLLETATKQIAIAIERARLFEEVKNNAAELEQRVYDRTIQLENANKEMEAFSYSVSHDLRTPLRAIDGFSELILEDYSYSLNETCQGYLNRIRAAAIRMGALIDDILRLSRITRAEMVLCKVDLSELVKSIAADLKESQPERKVNFIIEPGLVVDTDSNLIKIALENLIGNAWKFTSNKDIAHIEFGVIREDNREVYYVRDNGAGFDQAYTSKLFGAFQRLHTDVQFVGTGVGLATVKRIISKHGGEIWAKAEVDKGAEFFFTLRGGQ